MQENPPVVFNDQQKEVIALGIDHIQKRGKLLRIGGYAGTGKTTIIKAIFDACPGGSVSAFCGKACDVLRRKGLPGQTIHSLIYKFDGHTNTFYKVDSLGCSYGIIDEGSMVGEALWSDYQSYGLPIIVVGDPAQLEPVADNDPHLMRDPDYVLTTIHRQALDNPIIRLATEIRAGDEINWRPFERPTHQANESDDLLWPDVWLCGFNKTRIALNKAVRKLKGFKHTIEVGDRLICKKNDKVLGVFNGMLFTVLAVNAASYDLLSEDGQVRSNIQITTAGLGKSSGLSLNDSRKHSGKDIIVDYGYCLTVHASQGSEFDKVSFVDEQCELWSATRHRYTAVTRSAEELRVYKDKE